MFYEIFISVNYFINDWNGLSFVVPKVRYII